MVVRNVSIITFRVIFLPDPSIQKDTYLTVLYYEKKGVALFNVSAEHDATYGIFIQDKPRKEAGN